MCTDGGLNGSSSAATPVNKPTAVCKADQHGGQTRLKTVREELSRQEGKEERVKQGERCETRTNGGEEEERSGEKGRDGGNRGDACRGQGERSVSMSVCDVRL